MKTKLINLKQELAWPPAPAFRVLGQQTLRAGSQPASQHGVCVIFNIACFAVCVYVCIESYFCSSIGNAHTLTLTVMSCICNYSIRVWVRVGDGKRFAKQMTSKCLRRVNNALSARAQIPPACLADIKNLCEPVYPTDLGKQLCDGKNCCIFFGAANKSSAPWRCCC